MVKNVAKERQRKRFSKYAVIYCGRSIGSPSRRVKNKIALTLRNKRNKVTLPAIALPV